MTEYEWWFETPFAWAVFAAVAAKCGRNGCFSVMRLLFGQDAAARLTAME